MCYQWNHLAELHLQLTGNQTEEMVKCHCTRALIKDGWLYKWGLYGKPESDDNEDYAEECYGEDTNCHDNDYFTEKCYGEDTRKQDDSFSDAVDVDYRNSCQPSTTAVSEAQQNTEDQQAYSNDIDNEEDVQHDSSENKEIASFTEEQLAEIEMMKQMGLPVSFMEAKKDKEKGGKSYSRKTKKQKKRKNKQINDCNNTDYGNTKTDYDNTNTDYGKTKTDYVNINTLYNESGPKKSADFGLSSFKGRDIGIDEVIEVVHDKDKETENVSGNLINPNLAGLNLETVWQDY